MPTPVSLTSIRTCRRTDRSELSSATASAAAWMCTPPLLVNLTAFETKLLSTWRIRVASPKVFDGRCLKRDVDLYRRNQLGDTAFGAGAFPAGTFLAPLLAEMRREFSGINLRVEVSN